MSFLLELNDKIESAKQRIIKARQEIKDMENELAELRSLTWFCKNCDKYYPVEATGKSQKEETERETVYVDAGYGDDDEIADVTRLVTYIHCPVCGKSYSAGPGTYLRESNRRTRR